MGKFFAGVAVSVILTVATWGFLLAPKANETCNDRCGPGTECSQGRCLVSAPEPVPEPEVDEKAGKGKKKKKRKKKKKGASGGSGDDPYGGTNAASALGWMNDDSVPRYNAKATKTLGENTGSERLSDRVIDDELRELDPAFQKCIDNAAARSETDLPKGRVKYEFGIAPSGKVTGVNVKGSSVLRALGVMPCVRIAIHKHRFPSFDGLPMGASGSFSI